MSEYRTFQSEQHGNAEVLPETRLLNLQEHGRWRTVIAFCLATSANAALCMTLSSVEQTAQSVLDTDASSVALLYSGFLASACISITPATYLADCYEKMCFYLCLLLNVLCAWQRWAALLFDWQPYGMMLSSEILCGIGFGPLAIIPGQISEKRFPSHERALATSLMYQANFFGWLLGSMLPPLSVHDGNSLKTLLFVEVSIVSISALVAMLLYQPYQQVPSSLAASLDQSVTLKSGFAQVFEAMANHPRFIGQVVCYGVLGGVGSATPSALVFILSDYELPNTLAAVANAFFIFSGVVAGTSFGYLCKEPKSYGPVVKGCYIACALALLGLAGLAHLGFLNSSTGSVTLLILLSTIVGASSVGFLGIGIESAAQYPAPAVYVCWVVMVPVLAFSTVLSSVAARKAGFWILGLAVAACMLVIVSPHGNPAKQLYLRPPLG